MDKVIENRQWGNFIRLTHNEYTTVKIINILEGQELSLQYHLHRSEFWRVLKGNPHIIIGEKKVDANPDDEFYIDKGIHHRIGAPKGEVSILEISYGEFDEKDIIRLEDKYGRT